MQVRAGDCGRRRRRRRQQQRPGRVGRDGAQHERQHQLVVLQAFHVVRFAQQVLQPHYGVLGAVVVAAVAELADVQQAHGALAIFRTLTYLNGAAAALAAARLHCSCAVLGGQHGHAAVHHGNGPLGRNVVDKAAVVDHGVQHGVFADVHVSHGLADGAGHGAHVLDSVAARRDKGVQAGRVRKDVKPVPRHGVAVGGAPVLHEGFAVGGVHQDGHLDVAQLRDALLQHDYQLAHSDGAVGPGLRRQQPQDTGSGAVANVARVLDPRTVVLAQAGGALRGGARHVELAVARGGYLDDARFDRDSGKCDLHNGTVANCADVCMRSFHYFLRVACKHANVNAAQGHRAGPSQARWPVPLPGGVGLGRRL